MKKLRSITSGINFAESSLSTCIPYIKGKHFRAPFPSSDRKYSTPLDLVHDDLCGPMEVASLAGSLYQLTLVDDATNKMFTYFLKSKSEVSEAFIDFKNEVENQTGLTMKRFWSVNGTEFVNEKMKSLFKKCGIIHQRSVAYTPQQNGKAERANRTIVERARSMLVDAGLPKTFWAEAAYTTVYLINRSPTKSQALTPGEAWSNKKPD